MVITNDVQPMADAGTDVEICGAVSYTVVGASATGQDNIIWTHNGNGFFTNANVVNAEYNPDPADIGNVVTLELRASNSGVCSDAMDTMNLTIDEQPVVDLGPDDQTCSLTPYTFTGASANNYDSLVWSHNGFGSIFDVTVVNAEYTPHVNDIGNVVTFTLTVNSTGVCPSDADTMDLTIVPQPQIAVDNSSDPMACGGDGSIDLLFANVPPGIYTIDYDGGSFANVNIVGGSVTVNAPAGIYNNLRITVNGCTSVEDPDVTLTDPGAPIADAGPDGDVCGIGITNPFATTATPAVGTGTWTNQSPLVGNATFLNANDETTDVTVDAHGTYTFRWTDVNGMCNGFDEITVNFYAQLLADAPGDEVACGSYTLPALTDGNYFDGPNGGGNALSAGDQITNVGVNTIYVYSPANGTCPAVENSFTVTIDAVVQADAPGDEVACGSYTLPALTDGNYFDGPNGGGNALSAGDQITNVGVNTIYVYSPANGTCPAVENSFTVTIDAVVQADAPGDEVACGSYTLPALTDGNYFDGPNGGGNALSAGDQITNVGVNTIYVYSPANGTCPAVENSFTVTIDAVVQADAPGDEVACGSYTLPALTDGNYFDGPNGGGNALSAGDQITNVGVNTIYVYSPANGTCPAVENSFTVTIDAVVQADAPGDEVACGSYTLPALTDGNYFDGPNGGGNALSAGDQITNVGVNTIYVYSPANGTCPAVENSFTVTIDAVVQADAPGDEVACGSYTLPALTDGNYFDGPNGGGNALSAGDQITNVGVNTIYVYSPANGTCPAVENSFTVTIDAVVQADAPGDEVACGSYTLPALTDGNYFDGPNGGGNALSAGDQITNVGGEHDLCLQSCQRHLPCG